MDFSSIFKSLSLSLNGNLACDNGRFTKVDDQVDCYRNLNRANMFSIKARQGEFRGLVSGYARAVVVANPSFVVGEKARQRILSEQVRNVHSYVRGAFVAAFDSDIADVDGLERATYSPYAGGSFFRLERDETGSVIADTVKPIEPDAMYRFAILNGRDVFLIT